MTQHYMNIIVIMALLKVILDTNIYHTESERFYFLHKNESAEATRAKKMEESTSFFYPASCHENFGRTQAKDGHEHEDDVQKPLLVLDELTQILGTNELLIKIPIYI